MLCCFSGLVSNGVDVHEIKLRDAVRKARAETEDESKEKVISTWHLPETLVLQKCNCKLYAYIFLRQFLHNTCLTLYFV